MKNNSTFIITSTPIFLLGNEPTKEPLKNKSLSGAAIFFIILGSLIGLLILIIVGLYCYKRFIKKQNIPINKHLFTYLIHS